MFEFSPNVHGVAANLGRVCGTCNEWKTEDHFRRTTTGALRSQCDECRWAYYHANRDHILQNKQHYYQENREARRDYGRRHYAANRTAVNKKQSAYYFAHADERKSYAGNYRKLHYKEIAEYNREYGDSHREANRERRKIRRLNKTYGKADIEAIRAAQGNRCYICHKKLGQKYHIDHFIPLALGGSNDAGNLRLACPKCNLSKGARHPHELGLLI